MLFGYVFWFGLVKITTPEIIGTASAVISIATIFITVSAFGVPYGLQPLLGKPFSERKFADVKVYLKASLLLVTIGIAASVTGILLAQEWVVQTFNIDFNLIIVVMVLIASSVIALLFRLVVIASLKTRKLPIIAFISSTTKLVLGIVLVLIGTGTLGVTLGFTFLPVLTSILLAFFILMIFKQSKEKAEIGFGQCVKRIVPASFVIWIPSLISITGLHLGIIIVFGAQGATQAGVYFIAFSIMSVVSVAMTTLMTIALPVLSGMSDGRKRLTWRITKISLIITLPISSFFIFYSEEVMQLFGRRYIEGSLTLEILLLSIFPLAIMTGVNALAYSYHNYRQVLAIGLASSIPRTILYFVLVPIYGGEGAGVALTTGSVVGLIASIIIAKKIGMKLFWKDLILILIIPTVLAFVLAYFEINALVTVLVIFVISYLLFFKLRIIYRSDVQDSLGILPKNMADPLINLLNTIGTKLNRSY